MRGIDHTDIRALRAKHGLTQAAVARALGWDRSSLSDVETGRLALSEAGYREIVEKIEALARKRGTAPAREGPGRPIGS